VDLRYAGIQPIELANGQIVEFPTYLGFVRCGRVEALYEFIVTGGDVVGDGVLREAGSKDRDGLSGREGTG
jgi:hypothetical protein